MNALITVFPFFKTLGEGTLEHQILLALAFAIWVISGTVCLFAGARANNHAAATGLAAGGAMLVAGSIVSWNSNPAWGIARYIHFGLDAFAIRVDPLSSLFLALLGVATVAAGFYSPGYLQHIKGKFNNGLYWTCLFTFVLAMAQVILSANAVTFLIFWEAMSLSSVALVLTDHTKHRTQRAAFIYLAATRLSTSFLVCGFLWMHQLSHSWYFTEWKLDSSDAVVPAFVIFIGLSIKAGLYPFHQWLPYAHPEAPAPVSALMSGVMVKVAIYAMVRILLVGGLHSLPLAYTAIIIGTISSAWGVLWALMERDLKRMLAFSTVENMGLIVLGLGLALLSRTIPGPTSIGSIALMAALFHCLNHGAFKTLLFLGAGAVDTAVHSRDMNILGGLAKKMPATMMTFFIGSMAICAMPPLNGFASKWLLYQGLLHLAFDGNNILTRAMGLAIIGILSFVGALSLATFSKAIGITFLGKPRSDAAANAEECSPGMVATEWGLSVLCLGLGLAMPWIVPGALRSVCLIANNACDLQSFNLLPPATVLAVGGAMCIVLYLVVLNKKKPGVKQYYTWDCGYGELPARTEETASSFSRPIALLFRPLLQYKVSSEIGGRDRRHFPESISVDAHMIPLVENFLYKPIVIGIQALSTLLAKLQTGSIHVHLLYVFLTLLVLILIGVSL